MGSLVAILVVWVVCLSSLDASVDENQFLIKYAMSKARESCVGEHLTRRWERQVKNLVEECKYGGKVDEDSYDQRPNVVITIDPYPPQLGAIPPLGFIPDGAVALGTSGIGFNNVLVNGIGSLGHQRYKREAQVGPFDSATEGKNFVHTLVKGEKKILDKISNVTCVLKKLNVIDDDGTLQISAIADATSRMSIDSQLKEDLLTGLLECTKFVDCLPPPDKPTPLIPFPLKRAFAFIRCSQMKRQAACIKKDIRHSIDQNFPRDLQGTVNLEAFSQRMLDVLLADDIKEYESLLM